MEYRLYRWMPDGNIHWTHGMAAGDTPEEAIMRVQKRGRMDGYKIIAVERHGTNESGHNGVFLMRNGEPIRI